MNKLNENGVTTISAAVSCNDSQNVKIKPNGNESGYNWLVINRQFRSKSAHKQTVYG